LPSRRDQIRMSDTELTEFLDQERVVTCATVGPNGRPHLMPLWYVAAPGEIRGWTFGKSQKVKNLERDPHATLQVEAGIEYGELRGAMFECNVELERDPERVMGYGVELMARYGGGELTNEAHQAVESQAAKRVGMRFLPTRTVTWDHRKLGGTY